ncbi:ricin-type beta-trefoil lectin domain protein [Crossiella equi]|uniref:ricin-type beta-trefoil lectin domain protein n=1 Tax=Crossiella equi TaxID=130796 RepID=UPI000A3D454A|nr:ricin-type beta-trefoil lectin domain protein [Crossiella equi]
MLSLLIMSLAVQPAVPASTAPGRVRAVAELPAELEKLRGQESTTLYGSPEPRPPEQRKSSVLTIGDSQLAGEGVGNYEQGTDGPFNFCHRSVDAAVHQARFDVDLRFNLACSGAESTHLVYRSGAKQFDELNQGDSLAIKARTTRVRLVWLMSGANDTGGLEFGPVARDCAGRRLVLAGPCWPTYTDVLQQRVNASQASLDKAIRSVRETMREAGYGDGDYQFVLGSYPSPFSPDVEDNPKFPGWNEGGCLVYLKDQAFARNKVVPLFERAVRMAASAAGVRYLDTSRLLHGHEVCTETPWARGLTLWSSQQSFHPNEAGHTAYADCVTAFYANPSWQDATCVDPASTGHATLYRGLLDFRQLRNAKTGLCLDSEGYSTRVGYRVLVWNCTGGGNQGFWRDPATAALHVELTHDRCLAPAGAALSPGTAVQLHDCSGAANQRWGLVEGLLRSTASPEVCMASANETPGAPVQLAACNPADPLQQWVFEPQTGGTGFGHSDWIPSSAW